MQTGPERLVASSRHTEPVRLPGVGGSEAVGCAQSGHGGLPGLQRTARGTGGGGAGRQAEERRLAAVHAPSAGALH